MTDMAQDAVVGWAEGDALEAHDIEVSFEGLVVVDGGAPLALRSPGSWPKCLSS